MIKKTPPPPDAVVLSPGEACYVLGLSWNTLRPLLNAGEIQHKRIGARYIIPRQAIIENFKTLMKELLKGLKL
ncbi:MAG: helix-turn-helix domain-containing protein [Nitrospirae bacterium]|uniref:helix-turn-helix domain-containing protein n=1 Tax=Candidatus Magnetobacterium casense TaxID=1455061 RepID=UPI00058BA073|nr:helix-turn-helix domain-containing protein [Candidatus Magnetobacterium casensis]MBF0338990.1 helix-turn-helix domain-containing protein [Nitrospirota bacterium]